MIDDREVRRGKTPRDRSMIPPNPADEETAKWFDSIFAEGFPQKLSLVHLAAGSTGDAVFEKEFRPGEAKPTREKIVEMSNEFLEIAQKDCDDLERDQKYAILAFDRAKGVKPYARKLLNLKAISARQGISALANDYADGEQRKSDRELLLEIMRNARWEKEHNLKMTTMLFDRYENRMSQLEKHIDGTLEKQVKFLEATESLLSQAQERQLKAKREEFIQQQIAEGIEMLKLIAPHLINAWSKKNSGTAAIETTTEQQNEQMTVTQREPNPASDFVKGMTTEQREQTFGEWSQEGRLLKPGIFSEKQTGLFATIAGSGKNPDPALVNEFIESLTEEQVDKVQKIFGLTKLFPLVSWAQSFKK